MIGYEPLLLSYDSFRIKLSLTTKFVEKNIRSRIRSLLQLFLRGGSLFFQYRIFTREPGYMPVLWEAKEQRWTRFCLKAQKVLFYCFLTKSSAALQLKRSKLKVKGFLLLVEFRLSFEISRTRHVLRHLFRIILRFFADHFLGWSKSKQRRNRMSFFRLDSQQKDNPTRSALLFREIS